MDEKTQPYGSGRYGRSVTLRATTSQGLSPGRKALILLASVAAGWALLALFALLAALIL